MNNETQFNIRKIEKKLFAFLVLLKKNENIFEFIIDVCELIKSKS